MNVSIPGGNNEKSRRLPTAINNIADLLERQAMRRPALPALISPDGEIITYEMLWRRVCALARSLHRGGVSSKSRLAVVMPNGPDMALTLLGVSSTCIALPLNPGCTSDEFIHYLKLLQADGVLTDKRIDDAIRVAAVNVGIPVHDCTLDQVIQPDTEVKFSGNDDVAMVLLTSGSTGSPKRVPLTHANIIASVRDIVESLELNEKDCALSLWEQFHVGGLVDLLLAPLASGGSVMVGPSFNVQTFFDLLASRRPTWFQAVPATLHEILLYADGRKIERIDSSFRFIRSVAAALPSATHDRISRLFNVPIVQTFGMTEASPLITSTPLPPATAKAGSVGKAVTTEVQIVNKHGDALPPGEIGEVVIRGPNVMSGYENDPAANREAFIRGWFRTGDIGCLDADGELFLMGRSRELINRGGEKVWPVEIDEALIRHPAIEQAAAFPIPHSTLGEDVAVAVVRRPGAEVSVPEIRAHLDGRLSPFKIPRRVFFVDSLPRGPTGKVKRHELSAFYEHAEEQEFVAPESEMERKLAGMWGEILQIPRVGVKDDFFDLGGDSLSGLRLLAAIEREYGVRLAGNALFQLSTIRELVPAMENLSKEPQTGDVRHPFKTAIMNALAGGGLSRIGRDGLLIGAPLQASSVPLFWCFNSPVVEWTELSDALIDRMPVLGLFSGGVILDYEQGVHEYLADLYFKVIQDIYPEGPLYLGGNCRGGAVITRVARRFVESGRTPEKLIVVEYFDPYLFRYPSDQLLLYGKQSDMRAHLAFRWGSPGWRKQFTHAPSVRWLDGEHGEYFRHGAARVLARIIMKFMDGVALPDRAMQNLRDRILTWIHGQPMLFRAYVKWRRYERAGRMGRS